MQGINDNTNGLTVRSGRSFVGHADLLQDIFERNPSILFLGEPGSGKTTFVRETTKFLADSIYRRVHVVDTSNEIAGSADIPDPCIGSARRIMVPNEEKQDEIMTEVVKNHNPNVIVIDEISNKKEAIAAKRVSDGGVKVIASAHGNFEDLIGNKELNLLLGGLQTVTFGDDTAIAFNIRDKNGMPKKNQTTRAGTPVFDKIIQLSKEERGKCIIIHDVAKAIDCMLEGITYEAEQRWHHGNDCFYTKKVSIQQCIRFRSVFFWMTMINNSKESVEMHPTCHLFSSRLSNT